MKPSYIRTSKIRAKGIDMRGKVYKSRSSLWMRDYSRSVPLTILVLFILLPLLTLSTTGLQTISSQEIELGTDALDPRNDVGEVLHGRWIPSNGHETIDILEMSSYEPDNVLDMGKITLEMTVSGTIVDKEEVVYMFLLECDQELYLSAYSNGKASLLKLENNNVFPVEASGAGTETLSMNLPLRRIGDPQESFKWYAAAMETIGGEHAYVDIGPDKLLRIERPLDGMTVFNDLILEVRSLPCRATITSVEFQIDDMDPQGWSKAEQGGSKDQWLYDINTREMSEGEHRIYVQGTDGENTYQDSIKIFVDQDSAAGPASVTEPPQWVEGSSFYYASHGEPMIFGMEVGVASNMTTKFIGEEEHLTNLGRTDCWVIESHQEGSVSVAGVPVAQTLDKTNYVHSNGLGLAEEIAVTTVDRVTTTTREVYDPFLASYPIPLLVGRQWTSDTQVVATTTLVSEEGKQTDRHEGEEQTLIACLQEESVVVDAGEFDTFVIHFERVDGRLYQRLFYSPELGVPVVIETYDINREQISRLTLESYTLGDDVQDDTDEEGDDGPETASGDISARDVEPLNILKFGIIAALIVIGLAMLTAFNARRP